MGLFTRSPVRRVNRPSPSRSVLEAVPRSQVQRARPANYGAPRPITASAERIKLDQTVYDRPYSEWQTEAWNGYEQVGEVHYGFGFVASVMSRIRLFPAIVVGPNEPPVETGRATDPEAEGGSLVSPKLAKDAEAVFTELTDMPGMVRGFTLNTLVAGEVLLCQLPVGPAKEGEQPDKKWSFRSTDEVQVRVGGAILTPMRGQAAQVNLPADTYIARVWKQHPRFCVDDRTEALTQQGWKRHGELVPGDLVLTLDHTTGISAWQSVEQVHRFDVVDEPMVRLRSHTHSSLTTGEHRWPTIGLHSGARKWKTSATLTSSDILTSAAPCGDLPTDPKWSDAFVSLVAWWWTEGHDGERNTTISQSHRVNPRHCDTIRQNLTDVFGPPVRTKAQMLAGTRLSRGVCEFPDCDWPHWTKGLCKAHEAQRHYGTPLHPVSRRTPKPASQAPRWREAVDAKKGLTSFVLNRAAAMELRAVAPKRQVDTEFIRQLTRAQLELFIRVSIDADGHAQVNGTGRESSRITQAKGEMLDPFVLACVLAGYAPRSYEHPRRRDISVGLRSRVHVDSLDRTVENYTGTVWCPSVANRTWLARRDGTVWFTGNSAQPDSSMLAVADPIEELLMLQRLVRSATRSRLNAGLLFIPDGITASSATVTADPPDEPLDDLGQPEPGVTDPGGSFLAELMDSMVTPVSDEGSASAVVPMLATGPGELGNQIVHKTFERGSDQWLVDRTERTLERILQGLDIPKEIVSGLKDVKFANALVIDENLYKASIEPLALMLADALTTVFLRPLLRAMNYTEDDLAKVVCWYDPSDIVTKPNAADDASSGYDRYLLGPDAWRREHGFPETDAPSEEELAFMLLTQKGQLPEDVTASLLNVLLPQVLGAQREAQQSESVAPVPDSAERLLKAVPGGKPEGAAPPAAPGPPQQANVTQATPTAAEA